MAIRHGFPRADPVSPAPGGKGRQGLQGDQVQVHAGQDAENDGPRWASENDPRITRVGRIIRKLRLDELPQFINVIKNDMSFVGPRSGEALFRRPAREGHPLLCPADACEAGHHGLGPDQLSLRRHLRGCQGEAEIRAVLHEAPLPVARPGDHLPDHQGRRQGPGIAVDLFTSTG
ncbi:MAG: sugar transferase [Desulfomicrobium escambiense]|nr:sugar transferase [Desulfomicrobium escambiense]